jgi:hypothetical protein
MSSISKVGEPSHHGYRIRKYKHFKHVKTNNGNNKTELRYQYNILLISLPPSPHQKILILIQQ